MNRDVQPIIVRLPELSGVSQSPLDEESSDDPSEDPDDPPVVVPVVPVLLVPSVPLLVPSVVLLVVPCLVLLPVSSVVLLLPDLVQANLALSAIQLADIHLALLVADIFIYLLADLLIIARLLLLDMRLSILVLADVAASIPSALAPIAVM